MAGGGATAGQSTASAGGVVTRAKGTTQKVKGRGTEAARLAPYLLLLAFCLIGAWSWWRQTGARKSPTASAAAPAAEQRLLAAVAREPGSAQARRALGLYYLQQRQPFEALWELE